MLSQSKNNYDERILIQNEKCATIKDDSLSFQSSKKGQDNARLLNPIAKNLNPLMR